MPKLQRGGRGEGRARRRGTSTDLSWVMNFGFDASLGGTPSFF